MGQNEVRTLVARPLTPAAFAPFGHVVSASALAQAQAGKTANQGTAIRFDFCAPVTSTRPAATANLAVFRSSKKTLPFQVKLFERHPCSTQAFLPMVCARFLVVVAPDNGAGAPDVDAAVAFVCGPGEGVSYGVGVWHHPMIAIDGDADFAMLAHEDGGADDCVEFPLAAPVWVTDPTSLTTTTAPR